LDFVHAFDFDFLQLINETGGADIILYNPTFLSEGRFQECLEKLKTPEGQTPLVVLFTDDIRLGAHITTERPEYNFIGNKNMTLRDLAKFWRSKIAKSSSGEVALSKLLTTGL
jgi:hypothetical protein